VLTMLLYWLLLSGIFPTTRTVYFAAVPAVSTEASLEKQRNLTASSRDICVFLSPEHSGTAMAVCVDHHHQIVVSHSSFPLPNMNPIARGNTLIEGIKFGGYIILAYCSYQCSGSMSATADLLVYV